MSIKTTSPAYARNRVDGSHQLSELPWNGKINLRGNPENHDFLNAVKSTLGVTLPVEANTLIEQEGLTAIWFGPNEWLIYCDINSVQDRCADLKSALGETHSAVTDVSDYYTILKLEGKNAIDILRKACPMDLHPDVFPVGTCAQTRFGHASVFIRKIDSTPTFHIQVRWSYTEYVWDYLVSGLSILPSE